jgi:uncharacterized protein YndB with AHSA1/START domain
MGSEAVKESEALAVLHAIPIEAPPERVWQAMASQEEMRGWFHKTMTFEGRAAGWVELSGLHGGTPYHFGGRILTFEPGRELTFEWDWLPSRGWAAPTLLTIRLTPQGQGTLVELRHHGFERTGERATPVYESFRQGWDQSELLALKRAVEEPR